MSTRAKIIAVSVAAILVVAGIVLFGLQKPQPARDVTGPTQSPTATPFADSALITQLSSELGEKYQTFARADDPNYYASIKPYLAADFFNNVKYESSRYAGRVTIYKPIRSTVSGVQVTGHGQNATAVVKLASVNLDTGKAFNQTLKITWKKFGSRWTATNIETTEYGQ